MVFRGTHGDCAGYQMVLCAQRSILTKRHLARLLELFQSSNYLSRFIAGEASTTRLKLVNGTEYFVATARANAIRGLELLKHVFWDEAPHIAELDDSEYYSAIVGRLANADGYSRYVSTSKGSQGFFLASNSGIDKAQNLQEGLAE